MPLTNEQITAALRTVVDPELYKDVITLGVVRDVTVSGDDVDLTVAPTSPGTREAVERGIVAALRRAGAGQVRVRVVGPPQGVGAGGGAGHQQHPQQPSPGGALPQVRNVVAVGAGKGGVGKSTVAVNLAVGLARAGSRVGLMDGDIYGPSMPTMLGIKGQPPALRGNKIVPFAVHGIHAVTIGALVEPDKPLIWRGPMAHGAFKQLLLDNTEWPDLDYLVVDLPPGTGDVPLTLCQILPLTGAVVVATPQQVALDDAVRAVRMFQQLGAPVLGVVENMSHMPLPGGGAQDIFGRGGARRAAGELGLPFLGELPLFPALRVNSDAGRPHANFEDDPQLRASLEGIVVALQSEVTKRNQRPAAPTLTIS